MPAAIPTEDNHLSGEVLLLADNQQHNVFNDEPLKYRSEIADRFAKTAIRPAAVDLFSSDLVRWVVEKQPHHGREGSAEPSPVLHLGDACDYSCRGEFETFLTAMRGAPRGWVMAPGNHDGYFYGMIGESPPQEDWSAACGNAGGPLQKNDFVRYYLASLMCQIYPYESKGGERKLLQHSVWLQEQLGLHEEAKQAADAWFADEGGSQPLEWLNNLASSLPDTGNVSYTDQEPTFLRAVAWHIDDQRPWQSFIVQWLDISIPGAGCPLAAASIIALDTTQYDKEPSLSGLFSVNAGVHGQLLDNQLAIVDEWLRTGRRENHYWVLAGHHPFKGITGNQKWLERRLRRPKVLLYVSAHTHEGKYLIHESHGIPMLELNVGSIVDWPPEYRTLRLVREVAPTAETNLDSRRIGIYSRRIELPGLVAEDPSATREVVGFEGLESLVRLSELWEDRRKGAWWEELMQHIFRSPWMKTGLAFTGEGGGEVPKSGFTAAHIMKDQLLLGYYNLLLNSPTKGQNRDAEFRRRIARTLPKELSKELKEPKSPDRRSSLDEKVRLLLALREYDRGRERNDKDLGYRLRQVILHGRWDAGFRELLPEDEFILLPRR